MSAIRPAKCINLLLASRHRESDFFSVEGGLETEVGLLAAVDGDWSNGETTVECCGREGGLRTLEKCGQNLGEILQPVELADCDSSKCLQLSAVRWGDSKVTPFLETSCVTCTISI